MKERGRKRRERKRLSSRKFPAREVLEIQPGEDRVKSRAPNTASPLIVQVLSYLQLPVQEPQGNKCWAEWTFFNMLTVSRPTWVQKHTYVCVCVFERETEIDKQTETNHDWLHCSKGTVCFLCHWANDMFLLHKHSLRLGSTGTMGQRMLAVCTLVYLLAYEMQKNLKEEAKTKKSRSKPSIWTWVKPNDWRKRDATKTLLHIPKPFFSKYLNKPVCVCVWESLCVYKLRWTGYAY